MNVVDYGFSGFPGAHSNWLSGQPSLCVLLRDVEGSCRWRVVGIAAYLFLGLLRAATSAATSVTSEKEARTWPALLSTALTDRQIVFGKIIGSALQGWPSWLLLAAQKAGKGKACGD